MTSILKVDNLQDSNGTGTPYIKGAVLDVYQHTSSTQTSGNSTANYNSTGLFLTLTPKSSASKFLVTFHGAVHGNTADGYVVANIVVNPTSSTDINTVMTGGTLITDQTYGMAHINIVSSVYVSQLSASILHSPNTTSPVTYNVVFKRAVRGVTFWSINNTLTTLTAMEIGG